VFVSDSTAGIGFAVARQPAALDLSRTMSAYGTKQTYSMRSRMSAFGGKADIPEALLYCPLMTLRGHEEDDPPRASRPARSFVAESWQPLPLRVLAEAEAKEQSLLLSISTMSEGKAKGQGD
jgi:hypothetical protein